MSALAVAFAERRRHIETASRIRSILALFTDGDLAGDSAYLTSDLGLNAIGIESVRRKIEEELGVILTCEEMDEATTVAKLIEAVEVQRP